MSKIRHKNLIHLYDIMQDHVNFYLVMDFCKEGDLLQYQSKQSGQRFSEEQSVKYLAAIRNAFLCLRVNNVMHRDIKLENLFIDSNNILKIGDFGFAKEGTDESFTKLGSHLTMAPEIMFHIFDKKKKYNSKCDLWSIGVVFHTMLFGERPYHSRVKREKIDDFDEMVESLRRFNINKKSFSNVSVQTRDLLRKLLTKNPKKRISKR